MWCHNALQQSYEPVWVVLTDLQEVGTAVGEAGPQHASVGWATPSL